MAETEIRECLHHVADALEGLYQLVKSKLELIESLDKRVNGQELAIHELRNRVIELEGINRTACEMWEIRGFALQDLEDRVRRLEGGTNVPAARPPDGPGRVD